MMFFSLVLVAAVPPAPVSAVAYSPDGQTLVAGLHGQAVVLNTKGDVVARLDGQTARVTAVAFSRDGSRLAVGSGTPARSGMIRLYAVAKGGGVSHAADLTGPKDVQYAFDFSPDGRHLATAGYDRIIRIWDLAGRKVVQEFKDHSDTVYGLAYHPGGKILASASADRAVKVWEVATGKRLYTLSDATDWLYALTWSPDGRHLAAGGVDKSIRVWQADAAGARLVQSVFGHNESVLRLAYSADGQSLYSASEGKSIKKWDAAKLAEKLVVPPQPDSVLAIALRPDGKQLAVGCFDGSLRLIDTATGMAVGQPLPEKPKPPTVGRLEPNFAPRGSTAKVDLLGTQLADDVRIESATPGVQVKVVGGDSNRRRLEVAVGASVAVGPVALTVRTAAGTASTSFIVDRYPAVTDSASIDSARRGRLVALPTTVAGTLDRAGQADYFRFAAKAGEQVGVQILTANIGSKLDPVLDLTDADGRVLATSETGLLGYICPTAGTYAIGVRDKEYRGGADLFYRMHVGDVPIVMAVSPMGVARGATTTVDLIGVNLPYGVGLAAAPTSAAVGSKVAVQLKEFPEIPLGLPPVVVGEFPEVRIVQKHATVATPGTANGVLNGPTVAHRVAFRAKKGQRLIIETHARRLGSPVDSAIEILDDRGKAVGRATLRCVARTFVAFRDHDSAGPGIRLETWNELAMNDYVYLGNELLRIHQLPLNPDADCSFYAAAGQRAGFLDTTPTHHPMGAPLYKVEIHPPGTTFPANGMPVFPIAYRNDDGGAGYGKDSRIFFDPPADGLYTVRVTDSRGQGGPNYTYRLTVREPRPDFSVSFSPTAPSVWKGGSIPVAVSVSRIDGFTGPVHVKLENLPAGFEAPATFIEADQESTSFALYASPMAVSPPANTPPMKLVARATIDGREVVREVAGGLPKVVEPGDLTTVTSVSEVTIRPGSEARMRVKIERRNGFAGRVPVDVRGLPYGVRVLDVGLNGILITERDTEREVAIYAEPWVQPMEHPFVVLSRHERKGTEHGAKSVLLKVAGR